MKKRRVVGNGTKNGLRVCRRVAETRRRIYTLVPTVGRKERKEPAAKPRIPKVNATGRPRQDARAVRPRKKIAGKVLRIGRKV